MSLVRVDLLCFVKARDAAFLSRPDAAIHPKIAGLSDGLEISESVKKKYFPQSTND